MAKELTLALILAVSPTIWSWIAVPQRSPRPNGKITVPQILEKHIIASGGLEALRALQTLDANGSFHLSNLHGLGDFHFYYKAPASDALQLDAISHGESWIGHNEGAPFFEHTPRGLGGVNGVTIGILEESWLGLLESSFDDDHYARIELMGVSEIDGRWAYVLGFTPKVGDRQIRYYDCESFLMVRMDLAQRVRRSKDGPESVYQVKTYYSDYRDSGGINLPRIIRASASDGDLVLDVQHKRTC